jgi:hypothetical protein
MLTKVSSGNFNFGTDQIKDYCLVHLDTKIIQDNLNGQLLIKTNSGQTYLYDYLNKKYYLHNTIQIQWNTKPIIKQIESFDQNNPLVANKIRDYVLQECTLGKKINCILGIGGEYYIYFPYIQSKTYYGISNHLSIVEDAKTNVPYSDNYLVNYDNIKLNVSINPELIILNVFNIHENIIKYIKKFKFSKLIIIACSLSDSKLKLLSDNFRIRKIKYFKNYSSLIRVISCYLK